MAKYKDKWKTTFPTSIGNQTRPEDGVDNTQEYNTDGLPQYMANDPVRYDLQNAVNSQLVSNDERLNEKIKRTSDDLAAHNKDPKAHATGIAGNAATATKLQTPRTLSLTGKAAGSATFDGSANASINVTSVNADKASKLSTARKINITGNATGSATFDGTSDVSINVSVSQAAHADRATNAGSANKLFYSEHGSNSIQNGANDFSPTVGGDSANMNITSWYGVSFTNGCNSGVIPQGKTAVGIDVRNSVVRAKTFEGALNGNAATATKLATARAISLTGNASGSANFDGSGNISINTTVSQAANADKVDGVHAASLFYSKGAWASDNWATIGTYQTNGTTPVSGAYGWGQVISSSTDFARFQLYASDNYEGNGRLYYRTGWSNTKHQWNTILDSENYNSFAPTKTGGGASGTWGINISGNAASATNADKLDGYHASDLLGKIYPVGSIYMSMSATNPATLFGVGTWKRISQGRMLLGADDSTYKAGATGGEATHTLTAAEMPAHSHGISTSGNHSHYFYGSNNDNGPLTEGDGLDTEGNGHFTRNERFTTSSAGAHTHTISNSGGGAAHNNMPPYLVCYIWQRTA